MVKPLVAGQPRLTLALDDTPTRAVRAARPGGRHPSQPDPRPGRLAVRLRPRLRRPRAAGRPPGLGRDRPAAAGPAVRPEEGPAGHRPEAPAGVPHQAGAGRRAAAVGARRGWGSWASRSGWWPTGPMPRRRSSSRRCGPGDDGRQPAPQGRGPADRARAAGAGPARAGRGSTARSGSTWPSGPGSGAGGRPGRSTCTGSRR